MKSVDEYARIGRLADETTERILSECSRGKGGIFERTLYEVVFPIVFRDMLEGK